MEQYLENPKSGHSEDQSDIPYSARKMGSSAWGIAHGTDAYRASNDASLFSCSLPVLPHENLNFTDSEHSGKSTDDSLANANNLPREDEGQDPLEDVELNELGPLLPDDEDELLAGIMDDFDLSGLPTQLEDLEDYDLFGSGGGMEMDFDAFENLSAGISNVNLSDGIGANGIGHYTYLNSVGTVAGEHPYGEHPSRTLFVRNINSNVEDSELKSLFEQYGDIRTLYTACKHRGFVMISYYDIRAARIAMRALQNKPLRRRKLDIHFSIPKDNPSEKDINQGTLVVFNLDASVSSEELRNIFGAYGEVKEIRETPHKRHHKFIEFYDVRAAEAALRALNRSDIGGKRIKLEPSRPGGARRNLMHQLSQELEQDETRSFRHQLGSPVANSPPGNWAQFGSPVEHNSLHAALSKSPGLGSLSPIKSNHMPGLASILPSCVSNSPKIAPIGKDPGRVNQIFSGNGHSHSIPDHNFGSSPSDIGTLSGPQFLWGSPAPYSERASPSSMGPPPAYTNWHGSIIGSHRQHHVGSAPSGVPLDRQFGYFPESPETSYMGQGSFGSLGSGHNNGSYVMNLGPHGAVKGGFGLPGNGSPGYRMMPLPRPGHMFPGNGFFPGSALIGGEGLAERNRSRRVEASQIDSKKQFQLDLDKIVSGEDTRTTLMIKNIPNKYTSKMLLAVIDEGHRGTYDFLYLPIDFKNKCNVGYAFINMVSPAHIIPFYQAFNGKKWEKFNSEKVASLAYARIQGKTSLVTHFQNSSLMNEDKRCRPILFHSEGQEAADQTLFVQETLLSGNLNICIRQPDGSYSGDSLESPKGDPDERN